LEVLEQVPVLELEELEQVRELEPELEVLEQVPVLE
jgi:hypothetical protein